MDNVVNPYDPRVITDLLNLGLDPITIIREERSRRDRQREIESSKLFVLIRLLHTKGRWRAHEMDDDEVVIELLHRYPFPVDETRSLGFNVTAEQVGVRAVSKNPQIQHPISYQYDNIAVIRDPEEDDLYQRLVTLDRIMYPRKDSIPNIYESEA